MRKFVKKAVCLFALSGIIISGVYAIAPVFDSKTGTLAEDAFWARKKAQMTNECTVVYMGDSVCNQLWSEYDEDVDGICHIGCNQAITPAGSYLLLREYLESNPQTEEVYYLIRPQTIANDIWITYSYQYFVIPFCDENNWPLLDEETQRKIYDKFGDFFVDNQWVKTVLQNNNLLIRTYLNQIQKQPEKRETHRISKTAAIYLVKIRELCDEYGTKLFVKSLPLSDSEDNYGWEEFKQDIIDYGLEDLLSEFVENILYYPEDWFYDGSHFQKNILEEHGDEIREAVLD